MTFATQTLFLIFFTLAASLVLTLLINRVRRWRQRQRDEAQNREAEYENTIRQSHTESPSGCRSGRCDSTSAASRGRR
jgi:membrane protein implicated in regulation of membrane protease activity